LSSPQNHLIERLPPRERAHLLAQCEPVHLALGEVLSEPEATLRHVYFPTRAFISLVAPVEHHPGLEVGMVGREGMVGTPLVLGMTTSPVRALVQGAGASWRVPASAFLKELADSAVLQALLSRYVFVLMTQMVAAAGCLRYHAVGQRLARWLLMSQDRAQQDQFHITHEFLAYMLGVRRVGITVAAGELQRRGYITYHRGQLNVLDRSGLESAACGCYASDSLAYARHLA
jgi:CRP-like cAMP-binding protein